MLIGLQAAVVACLNAPVCTPQQLQAALSDVQPLDHEKLASTALAWSAGLLAPAPVPSPTPTAAVVDAEAIEPAACGTTAAGFAALQPATLCAKALGSAAAAFGPTIPPAVAFPQAASYLANASAPVLALAQAWPAPAHPTTAKAYPIAAASCQDAVFTPSSEIDSAAATPNASAPACSVVDGNASLTSLANNASAATSPSAQPAKRVAAGDHTLPEDLASSLPGLVAALTQAPALTATPSAVGATVLPCSDHASAVQAVKLLGSQQHASNLAFARNPPAYSQPQRNLPGQPLYVLSAKPSLQPLACQQPLPCQQALQPAVGAVGPVHCVVTSGQKAVSIFPVHAAPAASASGKEGQASPQSRSHATTYCWDGSDGVEATCCSAALVKVERLQEHSGTHSPRATLALMAGQGTSEEVTREASTDALTASKPAAAAASVPASPAAAIASESGSQGMQQEVQVAKTTTRLPELTWPEKRYIQHLQQLLMANRNGIYLHDLPTCVHAVHCLHSVESPMQALTLSFAAPYAWAWCLGSTLHLK